MVYTPSALSLANALHAGSAPARSDDTAPPTQVYTVLYQNSDGSIHEARPVAPVLPIFEAAFSAFARGTLIATTGGPVAIEDLRPGMKIVTNERGPSPLLWVGSMTMGTGRTPTTGLTRIMTGALGPMRPMADLMTGPGARFVQRVTATPLAERVLRPVQDLIDGTHVIALCPPGPIQLYHIALDRHATITAAGLAVETYHPGPGFENSMTREQLATFIAMFPHIRRPADFSSLVYPRDPSGGGYRVVA